MIATSILTELWNTKLKSSSNPNATVFLGSAFYDQFIKEHATLQRYEDSEKSEDSSAHAIFKTGKVYCVPGFRPWQHLIALEAK